MIYTIIGVIILILALILLLILFIPFHITLYLKKQGKDIGGNFQVIWLKIPLIKRPIQEDGKKDREKEKKEKKEKKKKKTKFDIDTVLNVLKQFIASVEYLIPILRAFLKSIKLEKLSLNLNLGFASPVSTALISGYFWSVSSVLNILPRVDLYMTPDFQERKLDASVEFKIRLTLYRIVAAFLRAFTKKPVRRLLWSMRKMNQ